MLRDPFQRATGDRGRSQSLPFSPLRTPCAPSTRSETHRRHAIIEQVHADLKAGPLAHLPSGVFTANSAWLVLAVTAFNLTRAAGIIADRTGRLAKATTATIRRTLIHVPARLARSARRVTMHLPQAWPWEKAFAHLFAITHAPPPTATA